MSKMDFRDPYVVRASMRRTVAMFSGGAEITRGMKGLITGILNERCGGDSMRYILLGWLFRANPDPYIPFEGISSKALSEPEWDALFWWIEPFKDESTGEWLVSDVFHREIRGAIASAGFDYYARKSFGARDTLFDDMEEEIKHLPHFVKQALALGGVLKRS